MQYKRQYTRLLSEELKFLVGIHLHLRGYVRFLTLSLAFFALTFAHGQTDTVAIDTSKERIIIVEHADIGEYESRKDSTIQRLVRIDRQVELRHDSAFMYVDTAILINNNMTAYGNVLIQQGDTVDVFSDTLFYTGPDKMAFLKGQVVLESKNQKLFTESLIYDLNTKVGTYTDGATITNDTIHLTSIKGYFHADTEIAYFKDSVVVAGEDFTMYTDTLEYDTRQQLALILAPTRIQQDSVDIYTESGYYDLANGEVFLSGNPQYRKGEAWAVSDQMIYNTDQKTMMMIGDARYKEGDKLAFGDTIRYDEPNDLIYLIGNAYYQDDNQVIDGDAIRYDRANESFLSKGRATIVDPPKFLTADSLVYDGKIGLAVGNVIWTDTAEHITVLCQQADYDKSSDYLLAYGERPWLLLDVDGDTLFLRSDTLESIQVLDTIITIIDSVTQEQSIDTSRILMAFPNVRMYKSDLQGVCDSLTYFSRDSLFTFYQDPVLWSDTTQFTADTLRVELSNDQIRHIYMDQNAFINSKVENPVYNQIKGRKVMASFDQNEIDKVEVVGNAESLYSARDEAEAFVGMNHTSCGNMTLFFQNKELEEIRFYGEPSGEFFPLDDSVKDKIRLAGFKWLPDRQPKSKEDL